MKNINNIVMEAVTSHILRVHTASAQQNISFALEREISSAGELREELSENKNIRIWKSAYLTIHMDEKGHMKIYDKNDYLLCEDYLGEQKAAEELSEEELEQLRQEGHVVQSEEMTCKFRVAKTLFGDETIYGLGEKTGFLNKKGYDYMMWNSDNPDPHVENQTFKALYKSIPFFIVLRDECVYGIFLDNTHRVYLDMGFESEKYYSFGATGGELDYYFIAGDTISDIIERYTMLTGRAPLPQMWTLGYQQSRWSYTSADEVLELAHNFRKYHVPCDVIHLDIDYMDHFKVFTMDKERFPNMKKLSEELGKLGIKLVTIIDPGTKIEDGYDVYDEGIKEGYFAKDTDGNVYQNVVWPGDSVYPDFTSSKVREWWGALTKRLTLQGIRGIWNDMNEPASFCGPLPDDVVFEGDGKERLHKEVHNVYGHLMAKATYEGLKEYDGRRPFVITRACYSGTQKYSTAWTGDNQSLWSHLQMSIPQLLNLGMSGMPMVGTDIGGFGSNTTPELLSRWIEASCFAPLFRNHSAKYTKRQEPWQFGQETLDINRKYIELRYKFLPYLYDLCYEESKTGLPILRPLVMHDQKDKKARECNDEYMVGSKILVAPVVQQGARARMVYLPKGEWVDYWTGERIAGECYILKEAPLDICPIYIKSGSIIPTYKDLQYIEPKEIKKLTLEFYPSTQLFSPQVDCDKVSAQTIRKNDYEKNSKSQFDVCEVTSRYVHYQDNGVDFEYQLGKYNLYEFIFLNSSDAKLQVNMLHEGYESKYEVIDTVIR